MRGVPSRCNRGGRRIYSGNAILLMLERPTTSLNSSVVAGRDTTPPRWQRVIPNATVFCSNLCLMALEIIAGRLIARFLGFSIYTWTSVIGVVLAGIALGGYAGGGLADRFRPHRILAAVFLLAALGCAIIPVANQAANTALFYLDFYWPLKVLLHVTIVFLPPSICLGMASPAVTKWALEQGFPAGRTVGQVYAWSAAGSVIGTFLTGFVLIPTLGTGVIAWGVAAVRSEEHTSELQSQR